MTAAQKTQAREQGAKSTSKRPSNQATPARSSNSGILSLQRSVGNRAVNRVLQSGAPAPAGAEVYLPSMVRSVVENRSGQPLDAGTRAEMEDRFQQDFSQVRVHADSAAATSARAVNAQAYTVGNHIAFDSGKYSPDVAAGKNLLAHELAHVVQQSRGGSATPALSQNSELEHDASQAAAAYSDSRQPIRVAKGSKSSLARTPASLTKTLDPGKLTETELQQEVLELQKWLSKRGGVSDPQAEAMAAALARLEAEVHRRSAAAKAPKNPLIPTVSNASDKQRLVEAMKILQSITQVGSNAYEVVIAGETKRLTQADVTGAQQKAKEALSNGVQRIEATKDSAVRGYNIQSETDKKHWIVSKVVKFIGDIKDPGPFLLAEAGKAGTLLIAINTAIKSGDFVRAATLMGDAEASASKADLMFKAYWEDIITVGELTVKVLEVTRDVSFAAVAILATIATAGLAPAIGLEVGGSLGLVNVVATGAALAPGIAETAAKIAYGDKVDWGQVTIDIALNVILSKFGGKLTSGIAGRLVTQNPAARKLETAVLEGIIHGVLTGKAFGLVHLTISTIYNNLKSSGKSITWDQFIELAIKQILDPKQTALDILNGAISGYGHGAKAVGSASSAAAPEPTPKSAEAAVATPEPTVVVAQETPVSTSASPKPTATAAEPQPIEAQKPAIAPSPKPNAESALELDTGIREPGTVPHNEIDLGSSNGPDGLELNHSPSTEPNLAPSHNEIDLGVVGPSGIKTYSGSKPVNKIPGVRKPSPTFGEPSLEKAGTGQGTGVHFHERNAAEMSHEMNVDYDPVAGRPRKISYRVDADVATSTPETDRTFTKDVSVPGAQSSNTAYEGSGYDKGHLAQREAFKGSAETEAAVDQMTNIVPMKPELNRGSGSLWRASESRTIGYSKKYGSVHVEIEPIYDANPPRLSDGTPVPKAIRRTVIAPDGQILEDVTHLNR